MSLLDRLHQVWSGYIEKKLLAGALAVVTIIMRRQYTVNSIAAINRGAHKNWREATNRIQD